MGDFEAYVFALHKSQFGTGLKALPPNFRENLQSAATRSIAPWSRLRAKALQNRPGQPLRLHLGSGGTRLDGWLNIDLLGLPTDLAWDLRKGIPFPNTSVDAIFHEHMLEHLPLTAVLPLLRECRRVLRPGGVLRIGVPDAERYIRDYVEPDGFIAGIRPDCPTPLLALAEVAYRYGHLSLWDGVTLCLVLTEAGFENVAARDFGDSVIAPAPDGPTRRTESVYVEGTKG